MPSSGGKNKLGYDYQHQKLREQWAPKVAAGKVNCFRCNQPIAPDTQWDLGHDDNRQHSGPEHAWCNRSAGGRSPRRHWRPELD